VKVNKIAAIERQDHARFGNRKCQHFIIGVAWSALPASRTVKTLGPKFRNFCTTDKGKFSLEYNRAIA
jgi:hypothetical protein